MGSRTYNTVVILFWLSTMVWLLVAKILPDLRRGDPPNHLAAARQQRDKDPTVGWDVFLGGNEIGWAATVVNDLEDNRSEVLSRIEVTNLETDALGSSWIKIRLLGALIEGGGSFQLRISSRAVLGAKDNLERFESKLARAGDPEPIIRIDGVVKGEYLFLTTQVGSMIDPADPMRLQREMRVDNEMTPRGYLPGLYLNRTWKVRQYSPLRHPTRTTAADIVEAKVERRDPIIWNGEVVDTWLVVYRQDPRAGTAPDDNEVARLWVRVEDGMVLKQQVALLGSELLFQRRNRAESDELAERLKKDWQGKP